MARPQLRPVQYIGRYRVEGLLGRGAWGTVYLASREGLDRKVAVKLLNLLPEDDPEVIERFRREGQASVTITHQGVPSIFEVGTAEGGVPYLVMEYLEGETLQAFKQRHEKVPPAVASALMLPVLAVLDSAHAAGFVHRDLKPSNLMLLGGTRREVKVLDFGMAKLLSEALTRPGTPMGTPLYMAPEQVQNSKAASPASDLYSVGVLLYELLSGTTPFHGNNMMEVMTAVVRTPPPPLATRCPDLDPRLLALVDALLSKRPEDRKPTSAATVRERLSELAPPDVDGLWSLVKTARKEREEEPTQQAHVDFTLREKPAGFVFKPVHLALGGGGVALLVGGLVLADVVLERSTKPQLPELPASSPSPKPEANSEKTAQPPSEPQPPVVPPPVAVISPMLEAENARLLANAAQAAKDGHYLVARTLLDACQQGAGACPGAEALRAELGDEERYAAQLDDAEQAMAEGKLDTARAALERARQTQTWAARRGAIDTTLGYMGHRLVQLSVREDKVKAELGQAKKALKLRQLPRARAHLVSALKAGGGGETEDVMRTLLGRERQKARAREAAAAKKHKLFELEKQLLEQARDERE